jgi:hypothetical protein
MCATTLASRGDTWGNTIRYARGGSRSLRVRPRLDLSRGDTCRLGSFGVELRHGAVAPRLAGRSDLCLRSSEDEAGSLICLRCESFFVDDTKLWPRVNRAR